MSGVAVDFQPAGAEDRATQGCDLSADPGAGIWSGAGSTRSPSPDQILAPCDKSWGFGGKAPNSSDSPLIPPPFTISHALFIELLTEPKMR
jgi:hypothetical protein